MALARTLGAAWRVVGSIASVLVRGPFVWGRAHPPFTGKAMRAAAAALTLVAIGVLSVVATSPLAGANAATPSGTSGVEIPHTNGTVTVELHGTWSWPGQTCAGRYGEAWSVDWWGVSPTATPANNFVLTTASEVTLASPHDVVVGDMSPTGSKGATVSIPLKNQPATQQKLFFHEGSEYDGLDVNAPTTCTTTTIGGTNGSSGAWTATATYPSASDIPPEICVNIYDLHGTEGKPAGTNNYNPTPKGGDNDNSITTNAYDPATGHSCFSSSKLTMPRADFTVVKADVPGNGNLVLPGHTIPYTITVTNVGSVAGAANLTDTLPTTLTTPTTPSCTPPSGCTVGFTGNKLTIHITSLTPGDHVVVTFTAKVASDDTSTVVNTVGFTNTTPCVATHCASTVSNPVVLFTVAKTDTPGNGETVGLGQTIPYVITIHNEGSVSGTATVTDNLPSSLTLVSGSAKCVVTVGCTVLVATTGRVLRITADVPADGTVTVTFKAVVSATDTTSVKNTAVITTGPCIGTGCSSSVTNPVAVFTVVKTDTPGNGNPVSPGQTVPYTLTITNIGTALGSATVSDTLPSNLSLVAGSVACGSTTSPNHCSASATNGGRSITADVTLAGGASVTVTFEAKVASSDNTSVKNTATITTGPCVASGCSSSVTNPVPILTATKSSTPPSGAIVSHGQTVTYGLTLLNSGSGTASGVTMIDAVPVGTTYVAGSASCGTAPGCTVSESNGTVMWSGLSIPAGSSNAVTVTFQVTVNSTDASGSVITNFAIFTNVNTPGCTGSTCDTNTVTVKLLGTTSPGGGTAPTTPGTTGRSTTPASSSRLPVGAPGTGGPAPVVDDELLLGATSGGLMAGAGLIFLAWRTRRRRLV